MSDVTALCKKDQYNFLSPYGLGDTMMLCGFAKAWESKNEGRIHFIIKPSHEIVMKLYGITNYTTAKFELASCKKWGKATPTPRLGKLFVAHPIFIASAQPILKQFESLDIDFKELYARFLDMDVNAFEIYNNIPEMTSHFRRKVEAIAPLGKIILFSPTANSVKSFPQSFWETLCHQLKEKGFSIISNVINPDDAIYGTHYLPMTSEEVVALAYACHEVYSLRSGLCDLIAMKPENLHVFYDVHSTLTLYGLNKLFKCKHIEERIVDTTTVSQIFPPLVTIVTVTYNLIEDNRKDLIKQCIESVRAQTYPHIEHIIVDGDSTDGTLEFLKPFENKGWIKIYTERDAGIYDAMNKGIDHAKGKYIAFLNSDDFYHNPEAVALSIRKLEQTQSDFSFGSVKCIDEKNGIIEMFYPYEELVMTQMPFSHQSLFCRRQVLQQKRFDIQFKLAADYDLILRLYLDHQKGVQVDAEIATYRMDGLSGSHYEDCVADYKRVYQKNYRDLIPEKYYDGMIRKNIVPEKLSKKFRAIFKPKIIRISLFGLPVLYIFQERNCLLINLFKYFNLFKVKIKGDVIYIYLFNLKCIKINKRKWRK